MSLKVIVRPAAEADIQEVHDYLDQVREGLGTQFANHLRNVFESLESSPEMYGVVWKDIRAARVQKFQYVVYYVVFPSRVEVLAVLHGARAARSWRSRIE
jgi:plasmid stabilization system protein ParE